MKIGEVIEVEGVKYIAQEEILACRYCYFDCPGHSDCYDKFGCRSEDKVIFIEIPLELLGKIDQLEKQIELMKNCDNCRNNKPSWNNCGKCTTSDIPINWEMKE